MNRPLKPTPIPNNDCQHGISEIPSGEVERSPRADGNRFGPKRVNIRNNAIFRQFVYITKTDSELVLPDDHKRVYLGIQNRGVNAIFLAFGGSANSNTFRLVADGFYEPFVGPISSLHIQGVATGDQVVIIEGIA